MRQDMKDINNLKNSSISTIENTAVDLLCSKGFALAQRVALALASSDAIPSKFRLLNTKSTRDGEVQEENPSAIGNCIVAIEIAQSIGMSVTAVMQNADVIEGKVRWSDKFVVACINASRRFTPLRFEVKDLGPATIAYKAKGDWDKQKNRYSVIDRKITIENNIQSIAWAFPAGFRPPSDVYTLDQAKEAALPVIEGPPVSIQLAVEEGWYDRLGSKWQTGLKTKMVMMRSGRYFGDVHAPDVTMGFGRTAEEELDITDLSLQADGTYGASAEIIPGGAARLGQRVERPLAEIAAIRSPEAAEKEGEKANEQRATRIRGSMGVE